MTKVEHIIDENRMTRNAGYKSLEDKINVFLKTLDFSDIEYKVIDIKYSSIFNKLVYSEDGKKGVVQFSALIIYSC